MIITYFAQERFKCNASVIPALMILQKQNPLLDGVAQCLQIVYMTEHGHGQRQYKCSRFLQLTVGFFILLRCLARV